MEGDEGREGLACVSKWSHRPSQLSCESTLQKSEPSSGQPHCAGPTPRERRCACSRGAACLSSASALASTYVENKLAQPSASWLSAGSSQRQIMPQAVRSFG